MVLFGEVLKTEIVEGKTNNPILVSLDFTDLGVIIYRYISIDICLISKERYIDIYISL